MKFTYTKLKGVKYLEATDEYEEFGDEFEYEPSEEDLLDAIVDCVYDEYLRDKTELSLDIKFVITTKKFISDFIKDFDLTDELAECYEDELWSIFEDEAIEFYDDNYN